MIRKFGGREIEDTRTLIREAGRTEVGKTVAVEIIREQKPRTLKVKIGKRPEDLEKIAQVEESNWRGLQVSEINSELTQQYRISEQEAVVVTYVEAESLAEQSGLVAGDVIIAINRRRIRNMQDYAATIKTAQGRALIRTARGFVILKAE